MTSLRWTREFAWRVVNIGLERDYIARQGERLEPGPGLLRAFA